MGELEQILPKEFTDAVSASGNEVVLPYVGALKAIVIAVVLPAETGLTE
jgi:hypothetical protein